MSQKDLNIADLKLTNKMKEETESLISNGFGEINFIETGNIGFDMALSGGRGLPVGASVLLWSGPGCGKSTLVGDVCKRMLSTYSGNPDDPFKVLYIDTEGSQNLLVSIGLGEFQQRGDLIYVEGSLKWRQIEQILSMVLTQAGQFAGVKLIVIDSVTHVMSDQSSQKSIADGDFGTKARERNNLYCKFLAKLKTAGISTFLISQRRQVQNATAFGEQKRAAVSDGDLHSVDIILKCSQKTSNEATKLTVNTPFGTSSQKYKYLMVLQSENSSGKNRYGCLPAAEILVTKGKGCNNSYVIKKLLIAYKYLKVAGGWNTLSPEILELVGATKEKYRKEEIDQFIVDNIGVLCSFLRDNGKLSLVIGDAVESSVEAGDFAEDTPEEGEQ